VNSRERVAAAIRGGIPDRVPRGEICIDDDLVRSCLGVPGAGFEERLELARRLKLDIICLAPVFPEGGPEGGLPGAASALWPDLGRWAGESGLFVFVILDGPFGWGPRLMGYNNFLLEVARKSRDPVDLAGQVAGLNLELARRAAGCGAGGVLIADDIAYQRGLIISPAALRSQFLPALERQARGIKGLGLPVFFHSDGNLDAALDDIARAGFDGLQCLEPAAGMDIGEIKKRYGSLCLWGNLDPGVLMTPRGAGEIRESLRPILEAAAAGGVIFGTSSGLVGGMIPENVALAYSLLDQQNIW